MNQFHNIDYSVSLLKRACNASVIGSFFILLFSVASAQTATINFDRDKILIGQQIRVELKLKDVNADTFAIKYWYFLPDTSNHIEVIKRDALDSVLDNGIITYIQNIYITSFDSGIWKLRYTPVVLYNRYSNKSITLNSEQYQVEVLPVNVTGMNDYNALRDIAEVPERDSIWKNLWGVLGAFIAFAIAYLVRKIRRKKIEIPPLTTKAILQQVLDRLEYINHNQPVNDLQVKQYYLRIDEVCRYYIQQLMNIDALQKTTDELILEMKARLGEERLSTEFYQLLRLCDVVKFAKYKPDSAQNIHSVTTAINFFKHTTF